MTDLKALLIPERENPWDPFPPAVDALVKAVFEHQQRPTDCGDHSVTLCACDPWMSTADAHNFRWEDHFIAKWNEAIAAAAVDPSPAVAELNEAICESQMEFRDTIDSEYGTGAFNHRSYDRLRAAAKAVTGVDVPELPDA